MNFKDHIEHLKTFYPICKKCHLTDPLADYSRLYRPSRRSRRNTFLLCHEFCDRLRTAHPILIYLLPFAGLLIIFLYRVSGQYNNTGTNLVLSSIQSDNHISIK